MSRSAGTGADGYLIFLQLCDENIGAKIQISCQNHVHSSTNFTRVESETSETSETSATSGTSKNQQDHRKHTRCHSSSNDHVIKAGTFDKDGGGGVTNI